jgi:8-oxo-dGTP pyrophosphatase MutT (NUDIX family)
MSEPVPQWLRQLVDAVRTSPAGDYLRVGAPEPPAAGGRRSAVLILFGPGPDILLIERSDRLRKHAGQPAFPGGTVDPGDDGPVDTALRESAEEVGLDRAGVEVVALLPELFLPPTGFLVTPVLAWWRTPAPVGVLDPGEVARVERVPVAELVDPANRCRVRGPSGYAGPAFTVRGMLVWGFTAAVLDRILELGGWARPWDVEDLRDLPRRELDLAARGVPPGYGQVPRGGPELPEFRDALGRAAPTSSAAAAVPAGSAASGISEAEADDGPAAEEVLPADDHGTTPT